MEWKKQKYMELKTMLADLRRSQRWIENAGRYGLLETLPVGSYDRNLTINTVKDLHRLTQAFLKAAEKQEAEPEIYDVGPIELRQPFG